MIAKLKIVSYVVLGLLIRLAAFLFIIGRSAISMYGVCLFEVVATCYIYDHIFGESILNMENFDKILFFTLIVDLIRCIIGFFEVMDDVKKDLYRKGE